MKKYLLGLLLVFGLFFVTACGSKSIVGTWNGESNDGLKTTFTFEKGGKVSYSNDYGFKSSGTYSVSKDEVTIKLDNWEEKKVYKFEIKKGKLTLKPNDKYSPSYKNMTKKK